MDSSLLYLLFPGHPVKEVLSLHICGLFLTLYLSALPQQGIFLFVFAVTLKLVIQP